jgi:hypothetical protein
MAELRAGYESDEWPLAALAAAFHIGLARLRRLAAEGLWVRIAPAARQAITEAEQEALQQAFEAGEEPVQATCAHFGIGVTTLYALVRQHGWVRSKRAFHKDSLSAPPSFRSSQAQQALAERLHDILGAQIRALALREESGAGDGTDATPRQLEQLIKCLKTLHDLSLALGAAPSNGNAPDSRSADDIRISIRLRLDQRLAAVRPDGVSGAAGGAE